MPDPPPSAEYTRRELPNFDFREATEAEMLLIRISLLPLLGSGTLAVNFRLMLGVDEVRANKMMLDLKHEFARRVEAERSRIVIASIDGKLPGGIQ